MSHLTYRPEIDGLRAIAVLSVVLFHAGISPFDGGYVGVDVFFVISGFLITSLIMKDLMAGTFSFAEFWERRIRRILPAQVVVIVATMLGCAIIFLPLDFTFAVKQAFSQLGFYSNIFFYKDVDYFSPDQATKPFLHFWSLAVEEQFYFVIPPLLWALWRYARKWFFPALVVGMLASFVSAHLAMQKDPMAAFFFLHYRAWELLYGGIIALLPHVAMKGRHTANIVSLAGLAMVATAVFAYSDDTPFPGISALLPCVGTGLIILGTREGGWVRTALSVRPLVFVGLVSYSWYLWHWPIMAFGEYVRQKDFSKPERIACVAISFILAYLSWKFIETPFRRRDGIIKSRRTVFITAFTTLAVLAGTGLWMETQQGFPHRFSPEARVYASGAGDRHLLNKECKEGQYERLAKNDVCQSNPDSRKKPTFLLWGDSQGEALVPAFVTLSKKYNTTGYLAFRAGCPPILEILHGENDTKKPYCRESNAETVRFIRESGVKDVFMVANWTSWVRNKDLSFGDQKWYGAYQDRYENILMAGVQRTVDELQKLGVRVHFVINIPTMNFNPPRALAIHKMMGLDETALSSKKADYLKKREKDLNDFIAQNKGRDFIVYDPALLLCKEEKCMASSGERSLYFDDGHLSATGANFVAPMLEPFFQNLPKK